MDIPKQNTSPVYKALSVLLVVPYAFLALVGRSSVIDIPWLESIPTVISFLALILVSFLGAYFSRKAGLLNMNAVHGIIAMLGTLFILLLIIPNLLIAVLAAVVLVPLVYLLVTATIADVLKREKNPGDSDITVMSFLFGKHKHLRKDSEKR